MLTLSYTNALCTELIEVPDPGGVKIIRDEDTPLGMKTLISIPVRGTVWVDGDRAEVLEDLRRGQCLHYTQAQP